MFDLTGKIAAITGGGGVLCGVMAEALARHGARVAVLDLNEDGASRAAAAIQEKGGKAIGVGCNVLELESLQGARERIAKEWGDVDILVNGAGGNKRDATTSPDFSFFQIPADSLRFVFDLNFVGTLLPTQVFGEAMTKRGEGVIINVSSMNAFRPLTNIPAYSAAKAAISNFTQWLAVHMCQNYSAKIRVNAVAPGFFLTEQNRFLLTNPEDGTLTPRGQTILAHTPMGCFGEPEDLVSTLLWLVSDSSRFVTGIVVPVDGGFSAFSGV